MADDPGLNENENANAGENEGTAFGFLPDGLQSLAEGYSEPSLFWADVSRLKGMDSELKALKGVSPETLASPEDYDRAFAALGRPADKSGYELPRSWSGEVWNPEGPGEAASEEVAAVVNKYLTDSGEREQFADIARRCDLTRKQADRLFSLYGGVLARHSERELAARAEAAPEKVLPRLWPQNTQAHLDTAIRGARAAGIGAELDAAGLSVNPLVLRLAHALGEAVGEDGAAGLGAAAGPGLPRGEEARNELRRVVAGVAYRNNEPAAIRRAESLAARVGIK